jgi:hypothetical protein
MPTPVKESTLLLFAFLYDALKIKGILNFWQSPETVSATCITISWLSAAHGPASKKKLLVLISKFI